jgi:hypothetical protein
MNAARGLQSQPAPSTTNMNLQSSVHIPLKIEEDKLINGSVRILSIIRPTWTKEKITFKVSSVAEF